MGVWTFKQISLVECRGTRQNAEQVLGDSDAYEAPVLETPVVLALSGDDRNPWN